MSRKRQLQRSIILTALTRNHCNFKFEFNLGHLLNMLALFCFQHFVAKPNSVPEHHLLYQITSFSTCLFNAYLSRWFFSSQRTFFLLPQLPQFEALGNGQKDLNLGNPLSRSWVKKMRRHQCNLTLKIF